MEKQFEEPNKSNVELGDLLVSANFPSGVILAYVYSVEEDRISAKTLNGGVYGALYQNAVILKKDGSYLAGKNTYEQLNQPVDSDFKRYQREGNKGAISNNFPTRER